MLGQALQDKAGEGGTGFLVPCGGLHLRSRVVPVRSRELIFENPDCQLYAVEDQVVDRWVPSIKRLVIGESGRD